MAKKYKFTIEIPKELRLTKKEIATLEGHFKVDAGNLLDVRLPSGPSTDETNVNNVSVTTRTRSARAGKVAAKSPKKSE